VWVVTADTYGDARRELDGLPCEVVVVPRGEEEAAKAAHVRRIGAGETVAVGNGRNDRTMLGEAALGIAVVQAEGAATAAVTAAAVVFGDIAAALDALLEPNRLVATLRS
jgi:soluble P-type ATPase